MHVNAMTVEERLNRIEHLTAGLAEERRRDREESRQLLGNTQRQLDELTNRVNALTGRVDVLANGLERFAMDINAAITRFAEESRAADEKLGRRIDSLVSAIGEFLRTRTGGS